MLAIIIPYYKLTYFEATLQSLANQTDKRFKVYFGDDASSEDCTFLLNKYKGQFELNYHRFETNLGGTSLTQQWERCIDLIDDKAVEWIMILGDDDYLGDNVIEAFYENYDEFHKSSNVVRFATQIVRDTDLINNLHTNPISETGIEFINRKFKGNVRGSLSEHIFKKDKLSSIGFTDFPSAFFSDDKMIFEIAKSNMIYSINTAIVYIRISYQSLSGKATIDNRNFENAKFLFNNFLLKNNYSLLDIEAKKIIIERTINYVISNKKNDSFFLLSLFIKSLFLFDYKFLKKNGKKIIRFIFFKQR